MSEDTADLTVTLKAGGGYDVPWIVVRGTTPEEVVFKLNGIDGVIEATIDAANKFKAAANIAPVVQGGNLAAAVVPEPAQPSASPAWGQSPAAPQQQYAPPQNNGVRYHPEGKSCPACNAPVAHKIITAKATGKTFELWTCPNQRSKGDGHFSEFAN